jgi:hypothetical protein
MHENIFAAVIADDKSKTLLAIEEFHDTFGSAKHDPGAHVTRRTRPTEATATGTTAKAAATAAAETATTAAAKAVTATAEAIAAPAIATAFKLVETAFALIETTTTPGTTSASIKAHFLSKSSIVTTGWCPSAAMR